MVDINPVSFPIVGEATKLFVQVNSFSASDTRCMLYYILFTEDETKVLDGNVNMSEEEFDAWGQDNSILYDLVASKLNLTLKTK